MKTTRSSFFAALLLLCLPLATLGGTTYYVSPRGLDSNRGTEVSAPFKTIATALKSARYGDTILLRQGTYREMIFSAAGSGGGTLPLPNLDASSASWTNMLTIQSYSTNEIPVIKGSVVVTNWIHYSNNVWMKPSWTNRSQQVFANDRLLKHLGWNAGPTVYPKGGLDNSAILKSRGPIEFQKGLVDLVNGSYTESFFHDTNNSTLYVRLAGNANPNMQTMEVSVGLVWHMFYPYVKFDGLAFKHSSLMQVMGGWPGVALLDHCIVQNSSVEWCDFTGISMRESSRLLNCRIANNGMIGFGVGSNSVVRGCSVLTNHYLPFDFRGEAAGTKIIGINSGGNAEGGQGDNLIIENNDFGWNINCPGIWFDKMNSSNAPVIIRGNDIHHNGDGIMIEISTNFLVYNNVIDANAYRGVYFSQAVDCHVYNNTIIVPYTPLTNPASQVVCGFAINGGWGGRSNRYTANIFITNNLVYDETVYRGSALRTAIYSLGPTTKNVFLDYNCYYAPNATNKSAVRFNINPYTDVKTGPTSNYLIDFASWRTNVGFAGSTFDKHSVVLNPLAANRHGNKLSLRSSSDSPVRGPRLANVTFGRNILAGISNDFRGSNRPPASAISSMRDSK